MADNYFDFGSLWDYITGVSQNKENAAIADMEKQYTDLTAPSIDDLTPKYAGDLTVDQQGPSRYESISEDPATRAAQMEALGQLQSKFRAGGFTPADIARQREAQMDASRQAKSEQDAITQGMRQRGLGGSGLEAMNRLSASQGQANRLSSIGNQNAQYANQAAMDALSQSAQLGGQIRGQDYSVASDRAQAADQIARYNNQILNSARERNLRTRQDINNTRADATQTDYGNRYGLANTKANMYGNRAQRAADRRNQGAQSLWTGLSAISNAALPGGFFDVAGRGIQNLFGGGGQSAPQGNRVGGTFDTSQGTRWNPTTKSYEQFGY